MERIAVNIPCFLGNLHVVANFTPPVIGTVMEAQPAYIELLVVDYEFLYNVKGNQNVVTLHLHHVLSLQQKEELERKVYDMHLSHLYAQEERELKTETAWHDKHVEEWKAGMQMQAEKTWMTESPTVARHLTTKQRDSDLKF